MQRGNHPSSYFIIGVAVAAFFAGGVSAQEEIDWKNRFFSEAPKRWEGYLRFARSLQITVTGKVYDGADRSLKCSVRTELKQTKGASLRVQEIGDKGKPVVVMVVGTNPSYTFKLKRRSPDSGWIITSLELSDQSPTFGDEQRELQESLLQDVCPGLTLENLWLPMLIQDPDFKVTAMKPQEIDGRPAVRFDFAYPKPDKDYPVRGGFHIKGGWMVLDPEHDWILREYVTHGAEPEFYSHRTLHIREGTDRHPIVTHATDKAIGEGGEKQPLQVIEGQDQAVERWDVPLEEFTLSAFGLPEPPGMQVGKSRLHLWIALIGIVSLVIAVLIRWQLRRTKTVA